ncbi:MAG TPA: J domain-containing protein [Stellaceae bacterium]|jgi:curved DNA-binding protein CbpA|nr:J domain-containing protein [Stellaceae bacterium]
MDGPYDILGVAPNASFAEIHTAFRHLAMEWHPDRNRDPAATARFQEILAAYELLKDPLRRAAYDGRCRGPDWDAAHRWREGRHPSDRQQESSHPELDRIFAELDAALRITPARVIALFSLVEALLRRAFASGW